MYVGMDSHLIQILLLAVQAMPRRHPRKRLRARLQLQRPLRACPICRPSWQPWSRQAWQVPALVVFSMTCFVSGPWPMATGFAYGRYIEHACCRNSLKAHNGMRHGIVQLDLASMDGAGTLNSTTLVATVFAPTNVAFTQLEKNLGYSPGQLLASPILKPTLEYHVVPGVAAMVRCYAARFSLPSLLCMHTEPFSGWHAGMPDTTAGLARACCRSR